MRTRWNGYNKTDKNQKDYLVTFNRYDTYHDRKEYERALAKARAEARGQYPDYYAFNRVIEVACPNGLNEVSFECDDYNKIEDALGYTPVPLSDQALCDAEMTRENSSSAAREEQAKAFKRMGYHGPVGGGEARALKNMFTEMGQHGLVRRGFLRVPKTVMRPPTRYQVRRAQWQNLPAPPPHKADVEVMQYCYVFKSPIPSVPFEKFIKLARMYRGDKGGLRAAVKGVLANPDAHAEVETIDAIEMLSGLAGMD